MEIINFKAKKELKNAVKIAAIRAGHNNSSEFLTAIVSDNQFVAEEMKKSAKKTKK